MKRNRFSEEQIISILKEHEAGISVAKLCRKHGVSDAKRLRTLEDKNAELKQMLADVILDNVTV